MTFHLVYRLYPPESDKFRPPYHSKLTCFRSAMQSLACVEGGRLLLLVDADDLPAQYAQLLPSGVPTEILLLGGLGNVQSYKVQLERVMDLPPEDLVYLAEDDYLFCQEALESLVQAATELPEADYFSLYDHPDRYTRDDDWWHRRGQHVWYAAGRHWRLSESSCMTFGTRVQTLKADHRIHVRDDHRWLRANDGRKAFPDDRKKWRMLQGLGRYRFRSAKRLLVTPMPSLVTHMDLRFLAPAVDWESIATSIEGRA